MTNFFLVTIVFVLLAGCQATKDTLTLKKKKSSDEFLIEKKNPLVLPPNYGDLPIPEDNKTDDQKNENNDIQVSLGGNKLKKNEVIKNSNPSSLEKSILEKIK